MPTTCLIVEDHADIRKLIRMTLEFDDYEIHEVSNAPDAVRAAKEIHPELFLLDVMMPGEFDGIEACRRLRADPRNSHARIVLLSAKSQASDVEKGMSAGADAYLLKPFSPLQLLETIETLKASPRMPA